MEGNQASAGRGGKWARAFVFGLFVIGMVFPFLGFVHNRNDNGVLENRRMAPAPAAPRSLADLLAWPKQFDAYFSDRFGGRRLALKYYQRLSVNLFHRSPTSRALIGKDGWIYFTGEDPRVFPAYFLGRPAFTDGDLGVWRNEFERRKAWFAGRGTDYLLVVVPEKYTVYPEFVPDRYRRGTPVKRLEQIESLMRDEAWSFLSLRAPLLAAKAAGSVYYRTDSHWNGRGSWVGYGQIVARLREHYPEVQPQPAPIPPAGHPDFYVQDLAALIGRSELGIPEREEMQRFYAALSDRALCAKRVTGEGDSRWPREWLVERWRCESAPIKGRVLVLRDSTSYPLIPLLAEAFEETLFVQAHRYPKSLFVAEAPKLVIEVFVERGLHGLADGYYHLLDE
jgi:alginate O-acetyltransferase complex protein AlgJ